MGPGLGWGCGRAVRRVCEVAAGHGGVHGGRRRLSAVERAKQVHKTGGHGQERLCLWLLAQWWGRVQRDLGRNSEELRRLLQATNAERSDDAGKQHPPGLERMGPRGRITGLGPLGVTSANIR